jgi:hypothetical protein
MNDNTTLIVGGLAVVLILGALYIQSRPAPQAQSSDISAAQLVTLVATIAAYW